MAAKIENKDNTMREYQFIREFSFVSKTRRFVVRFLDGSSYCLNVDDLPKKYQVAKAAWASGYLSEDQSNIIIPAGKNKKLYLPSHLFHSKGRPI